MTVLDQLFTVSAVSVLIVMILNRTALIDKLAPVLYAVMLIILIRMAALGYGGEAIAATFNPEFFGFKLHWRYDAVSWFFAIITLGAGLFSALFMAGDWARYYREKTSSSAYGALHVALMLNVVSMLLLLGSGDLLSLFIGWELVSWASFFMMALNPAKQARKAAVKYIIYAMAGAMAFMGGMAIVYSVAGSLDYAQIFQLMPTLSKTQLSVLIVLFAAGFGIKMGVIPFHLWQAVAYAETPGPGAVFMGAISARMGLYAIIVVLIQLIGIVYLHAVEIPYTFLNLQTTLAWIGALTTIIPTYIALQQNDARHLLAWHGVGQGGYMLLGLMAADSLGSAGGLLHVFNYATYQAVLFMSITAVIYRTGTSDFNKLGGLVTQMPLSFLVLVIGIIGLAGIPPMNGFVSKWLIYRSLLLEGQPFLFVAAVIGTLGTILSVYKLVHNTFLGQLRKEHLEIREAPWSMMLPMLILSVIIFITGMMPGIVLDWVAAVQTAIGLPVISHTLGGIVHPQGGLDMIWITLILFYGFAMGALVFYFSRSKTKRVHQYDNYAGGHFLTSEVRYHYSNHFYAGLMHLIGGWYRGTFAWLERSLVSMTSFISQAAENIYRTNQPVMLAIMVVVITLWLFIFGAGSGTDELLAGQGGLVK